MVGNGFESNADAVAVGAVRDLAAFAQVIEAALDDLSSIRRYYAQEGAEEWRAIKDGERDHAVEEGHQSNHEGDGYTSGVFVDAYIAQLRASGVWKRPIVTRMECLDRFYPAEAEHQDFMAANPRHPYIVSCYVA